MTPLLEAEGLVLPGRLQPTSLTIPAPMRIALIGPNGSGKTSLLRSLAGIEGQARRLTIAGEELASTPPARRSRLLSFLPASRDIIWPIQSRDVLAMGPRPADPDRIAHAIAALELENLVERPIDRLSTGERSRVMIARSLASSALLGLFDEPFANLDPYWVLRLLDCLDQWVEGERRGAIVSIHDLALAERFDRVLLVNAGRLVADGPPSQVLAGAALVKAFRVERSEGLWRISPREDRRSSP